jgi:uncharacterized protein (DUF1684 family)
LTRNQCSFLPVLVLSLLNFSLPAQNKNALAWQQELNQSFADSASSPLTEVDRLNFTELNFFPIDSIYRVKARLTLTPDSLPFEMATSTERKAKYRQYAWAHFSLQGDSFYIPVYQDIRSLKMPGLRNQLFLPYTDETNGAESYGGGRYIDLKMPARGEDTIIIDFNKSYNPYCAYNSRYSCPIPPKENHLDIGIRAGVKAPQLH